MKLYSALVRLSGSRENEVRKFNLTAAEIQLLRILHGGDEAVREIKWVANVKRSDAAERTRLGGIYSKTDPNGFLDGEKLVLTYFGAPGLPLPQDAQNPALKVIEDDEVDENSEEVTPVEEVEALAKPMRVERAQRPGFQKKPENAADLVA